MILLNGNKTERQRNSEGCRVLECGCACTDVCWLQMCDAHWATHHEAHARAAATRVAKGGAEFTQAYRDLAAQARPQE